MLKKSVIDRLINGAYPKVACFDIDGTLSSPMYNVDGELRTGGSQEWWERFCREEPFPYKDCHIPVEIAELLADFRDHDVTLVVLSQENLEVAFPAKEQFINEKLPGVFNAIRIVDSNDAKITYMQRLVDEYELEKKDIFFLDDTFSLVCAAADAGFNAHSMTELFDTCEPIMLSKKRPGKNIDFLTQYYCDITRQLDAWCNIEPDKMYKHYILKDIDSENLTIRVPGSTTGLIEVENHIIKDFEFCESILAKQMYTAKTLEDLKVLYVGRRIF